MTEQVRGMGLFFVVVTKFFANLFIKTKYNTYQSVIRPRTRPMLLTSLVMPQVIARIPNLQPITISRFSVHWDSAVLKGTKIYF